MSEEQTDLAALRDRCDRALHAQGPVRAADLLATIPSDTAVDVYGDGGAVAELETRIAALLGMPAAVYLPSGTMAQQAALRVHADRRARRTVAFHPMSHLDRHEGRALERLHGLVGRPVGDADRLLALADLEAVAEPLAALVLELPQRDLGGQLPAWPDLQQQVAWARDRGAAVHLDGARLWEAAAGYDRSPAQVAGLFDTTYVSFYKALGALPGCCLAGPDGVVAEVREWRRRMGGTLYGLWPGAASALTCLERRLPRMPAYLQHARDIAAALRDVPGICVVPDPPQTAMMQLLIRTTADHFASTVREIAEQDGIWTWKQAVATADPGVRRVELAIGDPACTFTPTEVRDVLARFGSA